MSQENPEGYATDSLDRTLVLKLHIKNPDKRPYYHLVQEALHSHADYIVTEVTAQRAFDDGKSGIGKTGRQQATENVEVVWEMRNWEGDSK